MEIKHQVILHFSVAKNESIPVAKLKLLKHIKQAEFLGLKQGKDLIEQHLKDGTDYCMNKEMTEHEARDFQQLIEKECNLPTSIATNEYTCITSLIKGLTLH